MRFCRNFLSASLYFAKPLNIAGKFRKQVRICKTVNPKPVSVVYRNVNKTQVKRLDEHEITKDEDD